MYTLDDVTTLDDAALDALAKSVLDESAKRAQAAHAHSAAARCDYVTRLLIAVLDRAGISATLRKDCYYFPQQAQEALTAEERIALIQTDVVDLEMHLQILLGDAYNRLSTCMRDYKKGSYRLPQE